jgi:hypothetical protein
MSTSLSLFALFSFSRFLAFHSLSGAHHDYNPLCDLMPSEDCKIGQMNASAAGFQSVVAG